jgi:lipopolysaccharide biosynthesis regulator YciM
VRDRVTDAARRALALDSTLADAHAALGSAHAHAGEWGAATAEFEKAVALEPDNVPARIMYGRLLCNNGDAERALAQFAEARRGERVSSVISAWVSYCSFVEGRVDVAVMESARAVQLDSTLLPTVNLGALLNLALGNRSAARRLMAVTPPVGVMSDAPYVFASLGDTATAWRLVRAMEASRPRPWFADVARGSVFLALGDTAHALDAMERSASRSGAMWAGYLPLRDAAYDPVRQSARFRALVRQAGADVRLVAAGTVRRR